MLGHREKFTAVPFFWSQHYDAPINYVGHAEKWDELTIDGDVMAKPAAHAQYLTIRHDAAVNIGVEEPKLEYIHAPSDQI